MEVSKTLQLASMVVDDLALWVERENLTYSELVEILVFAEKLALTRYAPTETRRRRLVFGAQASYDAATRPLNNKGWVCN